MKKPFKTFLLVVVFIIASFSLKAFVAEDGCTPGWAPFWSTSCTFTSFDQNGELVMYKTTCRHFIFTTSCSTEAIYDI